MLVGDIVTWRKYKSEFRVIRFLKLSPHAEIQLIKSPTHKLIKPISELTKVNNHV